MTAQRLGTWALILGGGTLLGAFFAAQARLYLSNAGRPMGWWPGAAMQAAPWCAGGALVLVILWLARRLRASRLEARRAQAELEALRAQLHPDFLFNTLHAISTLMHRDVEAADRMLADLSDLLRVSRENGNRQEVSLQQELEALEPYLRIEQARFPDRLTVRMKIDPAVLDAQVPSLILQPLVENAIHDGITLRAGAGRVVVLACRTHGRLRLEVRDDGCGLPRGGRPEEGLGLATIRARLRQLYGAWQSFSLGPGPGGGTVASLEIPFVPSPPEPEELLWAEAGNVPAALASALAIETQPKLQHSVGRKGI